MVSKLACVEGKTKAVNGNCNLYAQCVHGRFIHRPCPQGLVYDWKARVCNFPSQVPGQKCFKGRNLKIELNHLL